MQPVHKLRLRKPDVSERRPDTEESIVRNLEMKWRVPLLDRSMLGKVPGFTTLTVEFPEQNREICVPSALEHSERIRRIAESNPQPFRVSESFSIGKSTVMIGSPIFFDNYEAIPVYVREGGTTALNFAYRSKSQDSWRRYVGTYGGIFWKGPSEHLQNFDWRIQKRLDGISDSSPRHLLRSDMGNASSLDFLSPLDPTYVPIAEHLLQKRMVRSHDRLDLQDPGIKPNLLVDFWTSGSPEDSYGRHPTMIAESLDGRYRYGLALTEDGLVPKFIQPSGDRINLAGAPETGVLLRDEDGWVLTPIVEYNSQQDKAREATGRLVEVDGTILLGGNRVRIHGVHTSMNSPFFELNNGLDDVYRLLRCSSVDFVEAKLQAILDGRGRLPLDSNRPGQAEPDRAAAESRYGSLTSAFLRIRNGELDPGSDAGRAVLAGLFIHDNDLAVFRRYFGYLRSFQLEGFDVPDFAWQRLKEKLWRMSVQWARDMEARTAPLYHETG